MLCTVPLFASSEILYTIEYVMSRFYDGDLSIEFQKRNDILFMLPNGASFQLSVSFFCQCDGSWLNKDLLPSSVSEFDVSDILPGSACLPVLFGKPHLTQERKSIYCDIDIFGTIFFLLSRYEEAVQDSQLDDHGRFLAINSVAYKYDFLDRPIVDEYINLLRHLFFSLDSSIEIKVENVRSLVTCDVDWPFEPNRCSIKKTIRASIGDLLKRRQPISALNRWVGYLCFKLNLTYRDTARERVSWIMDVNEEKGNKVAFYFITECTDAYYDSNFDFDSPNIRALLSEIHERGHEIGLHPGYKCFDNPNLFKKSADSLKSTLSDMGIVQSELGGRMHYLRWDAKTTPKLWDDNGFDYDSTLSFAELSGFRCGTCHPFPMYDLVNRKPLKVIQRPLINMESTVIASKYEAKGYSDESVYRFNQFKRTVEENRGEYVLLWHNTHFDNDKDEEIYKGLI